MSRLRNVVSDFSRRDEASRCGAWGRVTREAAHAGKVGSGHNLSWSVARLRLSVVSLAVSGCLHSPSGVLHNASYQTNYADTALHNRADMLHNRAVVLHNRAVVLHNRADVLHNRAVGLHNRADGLHNREVAMHFWGDGARVDYGTRSLPRRKPLVPLIGVMQRRVMRSLPPGRMVRVVIS